MKPAALLYPLLVLICCQSIASEAIFHEGFDGAPAENLLKHTYGTKPVQVLKNGSEPNTGWEGSAAAHLKLKFEKAGGFKQSYWSYELQDPVPIAPPLSEISVRVKANVPVRLKIGISPYGFIYHGAVYKRLGKWERLSLRNVYEELKRWCGRGKKPVEGAWVSRIIISIEKVENVTADVLIDDIALTGASGCAAEMKEIAFKRKVRKVRISVVSQIWSDEGRTLDAVLEKIREAACDGADIVALPQECVKTDGEPIPGRISRAIADAAKRYGIYVIGNIRERDGDKLYITSFLCDRKGNIIGKYRKSHKMPDEDIDLGDELPVFKTDFGTIAMRIGTDRFFPEIDLVYSVKGARVIFWAQKPEPVEDEYAQDFPSAGRAADYKLFIACSRYAFAGKGYITNKFPPYCGCPIGRAYVINPEGQRIASTPRTGGGVATAVVPFKQLLGRGRGLNRVRGFKALVQKPLLPDRSKFKKRRIRITIVEPCPFEELLKKLDEAGKMGSDIVCLYEFVWIPCHGKVSEEAIKKGTERARENLSAVAEKAKKWKMYILVAGVIRTIERNEAILFDRNGKDVWHYYKIAKTYDRQICGEETPVFDTDFGRIAVRICADEHMVELDRCYGIKGADILFTPTQSWGPDALFRDLRDISRAMDNGFFLVECTHPSTEYRHRSMIVEPTGVVIARSHHREPSIVTAVVDLDNHRPLRFIRKYKPHKPRGYLPQYQPERLPESANDLREVILQQRRPELYDVLDVTTE